jgi:hypothetical protein
MRIHVLEGMFLALLLASSPVAAQNPAAPPTGEAERDKPGEQEAEAAKLTFDGEAALLTVAIRPDKTAEFERVLSKLQTALQKSADPTRQKQAEGWKVIRLSTPLPDGNIAYAHVIQPVIPGAGYGIMQILYDAFPEERRELYELYRGAFVRNIALAVGSLAVDMNTPASPEASAPAASPSSPAPPPASSQPAGQPPAQPGGGVSPR